MYSVVISSCNQNNNIHFTRTQKTHTLETIANGQHQRILDYRVKPCTCTRAHHSPVGACIPPTLAIAMCHPDDQRAEFLLSAGTARPCTQSMHSAINHSYQMWCIRCLCCIRRACIHIHTQTNKRTL